MSMTTLIKTEAKRSKTPKLKKKDNGNMKTTLPNYLVRDFFRKYASIRCAAYVADMLTAGKPTSRSAMEHLSRNGGSPSSRAVELLAWVNKVGVLGLEGRVVLSTESPLDENTHSTSWPVEEWHEVTALQLCSPAAFNEWCVEAAKAGDEWWNREGKYEEAAEEQGTYKDYLYACARAEQFGETEPHISEFVRL